MACLSVSSPWAMRGAQAALSPNLGAPATPAPWQAWQVCLNSASPALPAAAVVVPAAPEAAGAAAADAPPAAEAAPLVAPRQSPWVLRTWRRLDGHVDHGAVHFVIAQRTAALGRHHALAALEAFEGMLEQHALPLGDAGAPFGGVAELGAPAAPVP